MKLFEWSEGKQKGASANPLPFSIKPSGNNSLTHELEDQAGELVTRMKEGS